MRVAAIASVVLHAALAFALMRAPSVRDRIRNQPVFAEIIEKPRPPPPPKPPEEKKPVQVAKVLPLHPLKVAPLSKPPPPELPPPPSVPAPKPTEAPIVMSGITLESTAEGGAIAMAVGNTHYGQMPRTAPEPSAVKPYAAPKYAPPSSLTEPPELISQNLDLREFYPAEARQQGLESDVVLRLTLEADGHISEARPLKDPGHGFADAALRAAHKLKFKPAKINGETVATQIDFTLHFWLNG